MPWQMCGDHRTTLELFSPFMLLRQGLVFAMPCPADEVDSVLLCRSSVVNKNILAFATSAVCVLLLLLFC